MKIKIILGTILMVGGNLISQAQTNWQQKVKGELPLMGHRNWIVIVDSAYPLQSAQGIETVETGADQLSVVDYVLKAIKSSEHVRPLVHTDLELAYVPEKEAPGIDRYRSQLKEIVANIPADSILHQTLIDRLGETSKSFHVLVLKTNMAIPYTSVFLQLDCRYWSAESEARLREAMKSTGHHAESKPKP